MKLREWLLVMFGVFLGAGIWSIAAAVGCAWIAAEVCREDER